MLKSLPPWCSSLCRPCRQSTMVAEHQATSNPAAWIKNLLTNARCFEQVCGLRFREFDANGNGVLEFTELLAMIADLCPFLRIEVPEESKLKAAFDTADKNHDGVLSKSEFPPFFRAFLKEAVPAADRWEVDEVERGENERRAASEEAARAKDQQNEILEAEAQRLVERHNGRLVFAEFNVLHAKGALAFAKVRTEYKGKTYDVEKHTVVSASKEGALAFAKVATAERQKENPEAQGPLNLRYREVEVKDGECNSAADTEMAQPFLGMQYRKEVGLG